MIISMMTTKATIEAKNMKGVTCYVCGDSTYEASYVTEADGHARHCACSDGPTMHLQGIGRVSAIPAKDVKRGMSITWNYGTTSTVASSVRKSDKSQEIVEEYADGTRYTRLFRVERLIAARAL